jgi:hypothetical protein
MDSSLYTQAQRHPLAATALAVAAGVALAAMRRS